MAPDVLPTACPNRSESAVALDQPSAEPAPLVRDAKRQRNGTTGQGNTLALRHGMRSERYKARRRIEAGLALAEHRTQIETDQGGAMGLARVRRDLIDTFTEVTLFKNDLAAKLEESGAISGKGNTRRALTAYLALVNQQVKLAAQLGLGRVERHIARTPAELVQRIKGAQANG